MDLRFLVLLTIFQDQTNGKLHNKEINEHSLVSSNELFPYMAAILKKTAYLSAGALIDENWIITGADSLYMLRDLTRILRVRLGSVNYKKGGFLSPVKFFYIHPLFDDNKPQFDIALIKLPHPLRLTPSLNPVKLLTKMRGVTATHFITTAWSMPSQRNPQTLDSSELKRRRLLSMSHIHPTAADECAEELEAQGINSSGGILCFESPELDPCMRDIGAPVVLNGVLWGIISSWRSEDCNIETGATFVTLVSHADVSSWLHATIHGHKVTKKHKVDYDDNFI